MTLVLVTLEDVIRRGTAARPCRSFFGKLRHSLFLSTLFVILSHSCFLRSL